MFRFVYLVIAVVVPAAALADRPVELNPAYFSDGGGVVGTESANAYNVGPPVADDLLNADPDTYEPSMDERYFMSVFGPRCYC